MSAKSLRERLRIAESELAELRKAEADDKRAISEAIKASRMFREGKTPVTRHGTSTAVSQGSDLRKRVRKHGRPYVVWSSVKASELVPGSVIGVYIPK